MKIIYKNLSGSDLLKTYGLYKQITSGDNNKDKPSIFSQKELKKWESWNKYKGNNKNQMMKEYIEIINKNE
jgi:diazepam-binding inhibitor (GABA receptor modulating acyl-CoA-binding protein)